MERDLTWGSVTRNLISFTLPIFASNLLQAMYGTVDMVVTGRFADASALSAVSTGSMTMQSVTGIIVGLTTGCTVLLGQRIGAGDRKSATRTIVSAFMIFILLGIAGAAVMFFSAPFVAGVMNAPPEAFSSTVSYLRICGLGVISIMLFNAFGGIFRGLGDSRTPLLLMIVACAVNVVGDIVLVAFLGMGAGGAAAATVLAQCVSVIFAFILVRRNGIGFETDRNEMRPGRRETGMILMYGLPVAAQEALTGVSFMVILAILNSFGLNESAGVGIAEKICAIMFLVPVAFMSSVSAFTAQNIGAGKRDRARRAMFDSALFTVLSGLVMFSVSFFLGRELSSLFTDDTAVMAASADYLRSYSIDCILVGINFSVMGYLSGRGKTAAVALQGILSTFLVRIPFSYAMSRIPGVSLFQIGFATPLATLFAIVFDAFLLIHYDRKEKCV